MRHLCETIDRMAGQGPRLAESPVSDRDILDIWPRFAGWMIGTPAVDEAAVQATELCRALTLAPKILGVVQDLRAALYTAEQGLEVTEREWKAFRGNLAYRSDAYMDGFLKREGSPNDLADRRPVIRAAVAGSIAAASIAHVMFQYTRTDGVKPYEHPAGEAIRNVAEALGWWECQAEWHRQMPHEPEFYWKPVRQRECESFARRAAAALFTFA